MAKIEKNKILHLLFKVKIVFYQTWMLIVCSVYKRAIGLVVFEKPWKQNQAESLANNNNFNTRPPKVINDFERGVFKMSLRILLTEKGQEGSAKYK